MRERTGRGVIAGLGIVAILVGSGCSAQVPGWAGATPTSTEPPTAGAVNLEAAIAAIPDRVEALLAETGVPGLSVAVVAGGEVAYAEGFGSADLDTGDAVTPDTVFQLASVSKTVGASLITRLVSTDQIEWDAPVGDTLPWFRLSQSWPTNELTIADLYAHRSGLPDHAGDDLEWLGFEQRTILERLRLLPLEPFRASYAYTNYGIQAGALTVADAMGETWEDLSAEHLYEPLGMDRTTSSFDEYVAMDDHAAGHMVIDGAWAVTPEQFDPVATSAAASVASSANDMAAWMTMMLAEARADPEGNGAGFLHPEALAEMLTPRMATHSAGADAHLPSMYGYGVNLSTTATGATLVSHSGAFAQGAGTFVGMIPAFDIGIVVLTNGYPVGVAESVGASFLDEATVGAETRDWWPLYRDAFANILKPTGVLSGATPPADPAPARPLGDYAGTYQNDYVGDALVQPRGDELVLLLGPEPGVQGREYVLEHWDGDVFRYDLEEVLAGPGSTSRVVFDVSDGTLTIEQFDQFGLGTVEKSP